LPAVVEQVEPRRERPVEQPGLGEVDAAVLHLCAAGDHQAHDPAASEEVPLREVQRADQAIGRAVPATDREEAGGFLGDVDRDDDLVLGRPGRGRRVDLVEVVQVDQLLLGAGELLRRVEIAFRHRDLTAQDLFLAARVPGDVDALDEDLGALVDLEFDVDPARRQVLDDHGIDVGGRSADRAVDVGDLLDAVPEVRPREHVSGFEQDPAPDLLLRQHVRPRHVHGADPELRALDHLDADSGPRLLAVDVDVGRLHPGLDVAMVVVELDDAVRVLVELLPLNRSAQADEFALLGAHGGLDLFRREPLGALDDDLVDVDLPPLGDAERDAHVAVRQRLHVRRDADLEVPFLLVVLFELLGGAIDVDGIVDAAELQVDLLLQRVRVDLLVADEDDVPDERALDHDEDQLHAAFEVLDL